MTDPTPNNPPLWRLMDDELPGPDYNPAHWAPVLRAVANEVVPARECPDGGKVQRAMWLAEQRIRDRLLDEADRAEAGE